MDLVNGAGMDGQTAGARQETSPLEVDRTQPVCQSYQRSGPVSAEPQRLGAHLARTSNALKFTPSGGRITLATELSALNHGRVLVCVGDTGIGIPPDRLKRSSIPSFR